MPEVIAAIYSSNSNVIKDYKCNNIILIDTYYFNNTQYNLIRRDKSNLSTFGHIIIGFNTFVGEKRWKD